MFQISQKNISLLIISTFSVLIVDQFIKYKIRSTGGFYICNQGISFGLRLPNLLFWLIISFFVLLGLYWFKHSSDIFLQNKPFFVFTGLFLGGILSNLFDRLFFSCVFDYIFPFWQKLPVFNLADISISVSVFILILLLSKNYPQNHG